MSAGPPSPRTTVKRLPERGHYDRETIHAILDEGLVCHVGFAVEGKPVVIPTTYGRVGDELFIHGSPASRTLRGLKNGTIEACVTVTLLDGLVLAKSSFHHSMNYRSVVVFGTATEIRDRDERRAALDAIVDHILPGRSGEARAPSELELKGTTVLRLSLVEASAKVRTGGPKDDDDDHALPVWTGVLPLRLTAGEARPDEGDTWPVPTSLESRRRKMRA
jgi:nitroimidazol reductase NimA-like FMN-containing flavoprotein (pyridoxamine 5'-phosphate oxidase superfamily)